jgi:mediator of RNA polymerase II transcription subunit 12
MRPILRLPTYTEQPETADVFPWTGNHPEDTLSEALVKAGVSNKSQIMNETNTARPSLWTNLKNKYGLNALSSLFVSVLEKRQACGRLTAPTSFKPPPRLTLRDSTREAWLHDLANPAVGLRRLSRTIPHGITGTVLLDHCLNKNIPLPRAVWLAKCVGINEMRSHKRKGQAGTITWVKGWTSSVQQFLDTTIATMGQTDWKPRITYAYASHAVLGE